MLKFFELATLMSRATLAPLFEPLDHFAEGALAVRFVKERCPLRRTALAPSFYKELDPAASRGESSS